MSPKRMAFLVILLCVAWGVVPASSISAQPPGPRGGPPDGALGRPAVEGGVNWGQSRADYSPGGIPTSCPPGMIYKGLGRGCVRAMCPKGRVFSHKKRRCVPRSKRSR